MYDKHTSFLKEGLQYASVNLSFYYQMIKYRTQVMLAVYLDDIQAAGNDKFMKLTNKITE